MVSIVMGTNCKKENTERLQLAVSSILAQSYRDFEFIICENGASSEANEYLDNLDDKRVKIIHSKECISLSMKLNLCISMAKGELICRMDDDDISHTHRLFKQVDFLESNNTIDFVGCNVNLCDNKKNLAKRILPEFPQIKDFLVTQPFIHPTLCFKKECLMAVNGYNESKWCNACEDYDLLLRLYKKEFYGANLQQILFDYNIQHSFRTKIPFNIRINETVTRAIRFNSLHLLPKYSFYVIKPLIAGLVPYKMLKKYKSRQWS